MDSKLKILMVDDLPVNITILKAMLRVKPCKILSATKGEVAVKIAQEELPDLILLDVMMPPLDGLGVLEHLRRNPLTQDIKIYMVSAATTDADVNKAMSLGADGYIKKPVMAKELFEIIDSLLDKE